MVKLKAFDKFGTTLEAREAVANLLDGAPSDGFFNFLKANCGSGTLLLVSNTKLGELIKEKLVCFLLLSFFRFLNKGCFLPICFSLVEHRLCSQKCCYRAITRCQKPAN